MLDYVASLEFPELHAQDSFAEMLFFIALRQLMEQCMYNEFSWRDLHAPNSKRLRIQLSALINLVKYFQGDPIKIFNELNGPVSFHVFVSKIDHDSALKICTNTGFP